MRHESNIEHILNSLGSFCFGSGGLGDLLYLVGWLKDKDALGTPIVFWADNDELIRESLAALRKSGTVGTKNVVFHRWQNSKVYGSVEVEFAAITSHPGCITKGHIPDNFRFVEEWGLKPQKYRLSDLAIAKHDVPVPELAEHYRSDRSYTVALQPFGVDAAGHKKKYLDGQEVDVLVSSIREANPEATIALLGSARDRSIALASTGIDDLRGVSVERAFGVLASSKILVAADSWAKTFNWLIGKADSTYVFRPLEVISFSRVFGGLNFDPADKIFLDGQGFRIVEPSDRKRFAAHGPKEFAW